MVGGNRQCRNCGSIEFVMQSAKVTKAKVVWNVVCSNCGDECGQAVEAIEDTRALYRKRLARQTAMTGGE